MRVRPALALAAALSLTAGGLTASALGAETGDPLASAQFGLDQVRAPAAWGTSTGAGAIVAIVDSGVDFDHPDLKRNLLQGATFLDCKGGGSCGNGDWESGPEDRREVKSTHGTHVAGIAAAEAGNGVGIAGVAHDAKILPVKVLDEDGGSFEDIARGIDFSVARGADVVNLSLGALPGVQALTFTGFVSDVQDAITRAREAGVVVVAAAGNDFVSPLCGTPAFDTGALCVTATDKREQRSSYSNLGVNPGLDAVAGPGGSLLPVCGEDVVSTVPLGTGRAASCGYGTDYDEFAGTSMATPHVAGVATLLAAQGRGGDEIMDVLLRTSRQPRTDARGLYTPTHGFGIVDAAAAVATPVIGTGAGSGTSGGGNDGGKGGKGGGNGDKGGKGGGRG